MALHIVQVTKRFSGNLQTWGNRYIVSALDLATAITTVEPIVAGEKVFHFSGVEFLQARVSTLTINDNVYQTIPLSGNGAITADDPELPIFCTLNMEVPVVGGGRPSRKFYHTGFTEGVYNNQRFDAGYLDDAIAAVTNMIAVVEDAGAHLCDPQSQFWSTPVTFHSLVGFHQFTKASKRATP